MNEIEQVRRFRARATEPDPEEAQRARSQLLQLVEEERSNGGAQARSGRPSAPRRALAIGLAVAALPGGYAIAEGINSSGEIQDESGRPRGTPASSCPDAVALFERAQVPAPSVFADGCPTKAEVEELLPSYGRDVERMRELIPGWAPDG